MQGGTPGLTSGGEMSTQRWLNQSLMLDIDVPAAAQGDYARRLRKAETAERVIGGGDGTISTAVSQLLELKRPFAVVPLGTANDFARTLGSPPIPGALICSTFPRSFR